MKIKTMENKGIHITRDDGLTFSIQFGVYNYCENYRKENYPKGLNIESNDCEVAVWDNEGNWITKEFFPENDDDVVGYIPIEKALRMALDSKRNI